MSVIKNILDLLEVPLVDESMHQEEPNNRTLNQWKVSFPVIGVIGLLGTIKCKASIPLVNSAQIDLSLVQFRPNTCYHLLGYKLTQSILCVVADFLQCASLNAAASGYLIACCRSK